MDNLSFFGGFTFALALLCVGWFVLWWMDGSAKPLLRRSRRITRRSTVIFACPSCGQKNRLALMRLAETYYRPICGSCQAHLIFEKR
jgi:predicted RNA-binding Zn-ribbon protein involved in translation (DUF1610 family)